MPTWLPSNAAHVWYTALHQFITDPYVHICSTRLDRTMYETPCAIMYVNLPAESLPCTVYTPQFFCAGQRYSCTLICFTHASVLIINSDPHCPVQWEVCWDALKVSQWLRKTWAGGKADHLHLHPQWHASWLCVWVLHVWWVPHRFGRAQRLG